MGRTLIAITILAVGLGGLTSGCFKGKPAPSAASGTIETDEAHVGSRYGGRIESIRVQEGDTLQTGQTILELAAAELHARRSQAAAVLAEMEAGPRPEEIVEAKSSWESMMAELEFERSDRARAEELFKQNAISETERDRTSSRASALEKNAAAAKARYELLKAGTRAERIEQARAQLAEIDAHIKEMTVTAPTNCVLEVLHVKAGDVLPPNAPVATLLLPHLWVRVFVPAPWLGHLHLNDTVKVRVDSFPDQEFDGKIEQINRAAEFTPRNVQTTEERTKQVFGVKVRLEAMDRLRAGMSADVTFPSIPASLKDASKSP